MTVATLHNPLQIVEQTFDDIDAMAAAALEWDQQYEHVGRGRFRGKLTQLVLAQLQLNRERWTPGVLQRGAAPKNSWVFGLPVKSEGSLHIRRRPVQRGELLTGNSRDDVGFTAGGPTDLMIVVIPNGVIRQWMQLRRGVDGLDPDLPPRHWAVTGTEMARRSSTLSQLHRELLDQSKVGVMPGLVRRIQSRISDTILDIIPSAEALEALHSRARIARSVLELLDECRDDPPTVTEMCEKVGARERTLFLSCVEAFGRPPTRLLLELRLNAVHRALVHPTKGTSVTVAACHFGFTHLGRFSSMYVRQFGELPSATLAKALGAA